MMDTSEMSEVLPAEIALLRRRMAEVEQINAALHRETTELRQQVETLRKSEAQYRLVAEHADEVFWVWEPGEARLLYVNPAYERLTGYSCASLYTDPASFYTLIHPNDRERIGTPVCWHHVGSREYRIMTRQQQICWVAEYSTTIYDDQSKAVRQVGVLRDITALKKHEAQIEQLLHFDPLTGLANRRWMEEIGSTILAAARETPASTALLYLNLDRFKSINETLGHPAGDELLMQVATRLRSCVGSMAALARIGGDEFAVLLPHTDSTQAAAVATQILEHLRQPFFIHEQIVYVEGSIGVTISTANVETFSTFLSQADTAMYQARTTGSGVQIYDPIFHVIPQNQILLETDLRLALATDELTLYYQPVLDLRTNHVSKVEALIRWLHPAHGLLTPDRFLPLAEEIGLMRSLDSWVLEKAAHQAAAWARAGQALGVAINLTSHSLQDPALVGEVTRLLDASGAPPERLTIELTEHSGLRDLAATQQVLAQLKALGLRVALDDFGNGYASLNYLQQMPFDVLKVDKSFTVGLGNEPRDEAVARALLSLGRGIGIEVVFEGVENRTQIKWLREAGCTWVQGYFIGRPVPAAQIRDDRINW